MLCYSFGDFEYLFLNVRSLISLNSLLPNDVKVWKNWSTVVSMRINILVFNKLKAVAAPCVRAYLVNAWAVETFSKNSDWFNSFDWLSPCSSNVNSPCYWVKCSFDFCLISYLWFLDWSFLKISDRIIFPIHIIIIIINYIRFNLQISKPSLILIVKTSISCIIHTSFQAYGSFLSWSSNSYLLINFCLPNNVSKQAQYNIRF